ncbi:MAG: hypothetical protein IIC66_09650 [candidate division Zixibacteria bacterium]|nr:hypothetical protein [candidate division Zixibacteria bacterium]
MQKKRTDYISWDDYFMGVAQLSAHRSKDPGTQVGACIVNSKKRIIGIGYNGFPAGCSDDLLPWDRKGDYLDTKYPYVCHAEMNAITNSSNKPELDGASIYVSPFPLITLRIRKCTCSLNSLEDNHQKPSCLTQ